MNIKSLILGSAAALVAVSGARAADAVIMAEPEPVEYVRVCDAYGAGFFYIPGTETCLQISGYVWYQIGFNGYEAVPTAVPGDANGDGVIGAGETIIVDTSNDTPGYIGGRVGDGWLKTTRARINFDARSDTEWGTLRAYARIQASWGTPVDGPASFDQAYIQLGGLMLGYSESFFVDSKNGGPSNYGSHSWGGMYYGYQQRHLIGYRFGGSQGFFGAIALEDDTLAGEGYMPDIVGKIGVAQAWGAAWLVVGYDESRNALGDDGFAVQAGAHINAGPPGSSLRLIGYYNDSDNAYGPSSALGVDPEWSVLASYQYAFSPTLAVSVGGQYFSDLYFAGTDISTGLDAWGAELSVVWTPVTNFEVRTELHYDEVDDLDGTFSGYLRFTRYF
ncbi:MAG: porin [Rhizobiaceae bacterium]|nr:porin [Rhizobiaceae bacterium]MCV0408043.1 porin [Rhizobiaceae bacterium]